jgi:hypothetical protein
MHLARTGSVSVAQSWLVALARPGGPEIRSEVLACFSGCVAYSCIMALLSKLPRPCVVIVNFSSESNMQPGMTILPWRVPTLLSLQGPVSGR